MAQPSAAQRAAAHFVHAVRHLQAAAGGDGGGAADPAALQAAAASFATVSDVTADAQANNAEDLLVFLLSG